MRVCTLCIHPAKTQIDEALTLGQSTRAVAARFHVSKSAVGRHLSGCLRPLVAAAARMTAAPAEIRAPVQRAKAISSGAAPTPQELLSQSALLERIARSLERLEGAADSAAASDLHMPLSALSGQLHKGIETAAKLQGLMSEPPPTAESKFSVKIIFQPGYEPVDVHGSAKGLQPISAEYSQRDSLLDPSPEALPSSDKEASEATAFPIPGFQLA